MKLSYFITQTHSIESDEHGNFDVFDLNLLLALVGGWSLQDFTALDDAIVTRAIPGQEQPETRFIPRELDRAKIEKLANNYGLYPLMPINMNDFAQELAARFPVAITGVPSAEGKLLGVWCVESLGAYGAADIFKSGWRTGANEYVKTTSSNLAEAICLNVLNRIGLGKSAYIFYPEMSVTNGELVYMSARSLKTLEMDKRFMANLVPVPSLNPYAIIPAPEEMVKDALEYADNVVVIQKAPLRTQEVAAQVETDHVAEEPTAIDADHQTPDAENPAPDMPEASHAVIEGETVIPVDDAGNIVVETPVDNDLAPSQGHPESAPDVIAEQEVTEAVKTEEMEE